MDKKRIFDLENPDDVAYLISYVNDDMAVNSEAEGDSDADDNVPLGSLISSGRSSRASEQAMSLQNIVEDDTLEMELVRESVSAIQEDGPRPRIFDQEDEKSDEESSTSSEDESTKWTRSDATPQTFAKSNFSRRFGVTGKNEFDLSSPKKIFLTVISTIFLQYIVEQSNLYAIQNGQTLNLTMEELKAYFGMLIIMGFHSLPSLRLYWSKDCNFGVPRIQQVMPLKRFLRITRLLHFNDNLCMPRKEHADYDKLYKIRPFLEYVSKRFQLLFSPSRYLSIDESMVKYKGRSTLKQYMPMKPIKRGFKIWVIACAVTGYCLGMAMYEGAEKGSVKSLSLGERVVNKLSSAFAGFGYCLFFDNFFSSIPLAKNLLKKSFFSCATIRQTRKFFPKELLKSDKAMKAGEHDGATDGEITISKWMDRGKKSVCVISTMHSASKTAHVLRTQPTGERKLVQCPEAISDYNKYMGGVDHFDQLLSSYSISWKSRRWWMRIYYYCLDACVVNSYIIYKTTLNQSSDKSKPMSHLEFRSVLASQLIGSYSGRSKPGPISQCGRGRKKNQPEGRSTVYNAMRLNNVGKHLPMIGSRRRCCHCSTAKKQQRSKVICKECNVALCVECFIPFHKND